MDNIQDRMSSSVSKQSGPQTNEKRCARRKIVKPKLQRQTLVLWVAVFSLQGAVWAKAAVLIDAGGHPLWALMAPHVGVEFLNKLIVIKLDR